MKIGLRRVIDVNLSETPLSRKGNGLHTKHSFSSIPMLRFVSLGRRLLLAFKTSVNTLYLGNSKSFSWRFRSSRRR